MKALYPLLVVLALALVAFLGAQVGALHLLFAVAIPYAAVVLFLGGFVYRVVKWAQVPVPFRITTTCGQQQSLPWIKSNNLESPHNTLGVIGRMAMEVLFFRSLFRNSTTELRGNRLIYGEEKLLWLGGLVFHWSFLIIVLRHLRFFTQPVPFFVPVLQAVDGFLQVGTPAVYITGVTVMVGLAFLFARRVWMPQIRYISLPSDYFPLYLIFGIALTGVLMRYFFRVDVVAVKELALGLISLRPVMTVPQGVSPLFFTHLFLVSSLLAYFPLSKLMHMGGIFLSPTRNLANTNRARRHVNPWNYPVPVHTYAEWEEEFRDKLEMADIPLDHPHMVPSEPGKQPEILAQGGQ